MNAVSVFHLFLCLNDLFRCQPEPSHFEHLYVLIWIKLCSFLLPRLVWSCAVASTTTRAAFVVGPRYYSRSSLKMTGTDEVEAAKAAAAAYESSDKDGAGPATIFDKILSGEWSSDKVFEDEKCLAFRDINPQAPTHIVLIPKKRDGLIKLSDAREDQKDVLGHLMYVGSQIAKKQCPNGFRLVVNDGSDGAQSVYHLHVHILGGRQMRWPPG